MLKALIYISFIFSISACAGKAIVDSSPSVNEPNGIEGSIIWLKNKTIKAKMDINLLIKNTYSHPIVINPDSIIVDYNGSRNTSTENTNDRTILKTGDAQDIIVTFKFRDNLKPKGRGTILIKNIYVYDYDKDKKGKKLKDLKIPFDSKPMRFKKTSVKGGKIKSGSY